MRCSPAVYLGVYLVASAAVCAWGQPTTGRGAFQSVSEVRPVTLQVQAMFWTNGREAPARDLVLIRVKVQNTGDFFPTDIGPPLFVLGDTVCHVLVDPAASGEAVLVAPRPPGSQAATLWLTDRGIMAQQLTAERVRTLRTRAQRPQVPRTIQVAAPPANLRATAYTDLGALAVSVSPSRVPR
jgi:hypothetical protein